MKVKHQQNIQIAPSPKDKKKPNHLENAQLSDAVVDEHLPKTMPHTYLTINHLKYDFGCIEGVN